MDDKPKEDKTDEQEGEGTFELEDTPQHTPTEVYQAAVAAIIVAAGYHMVTKSAAQVFVEILRETLHWQFAKPGTHPTPAEMLQEFVMMTMAPASSDATPPKGTND